jgi:hypothetical protein
MARTKRGVLEGVRSLAAGAIAAAIAPVLGCADPWSRTPLADRCGLVQSRPGAGDGYVIEWTCRASLRAYLRVCPLPGDAGSEVNPDKLGSWIVLRGTGSTHLGAALAPGIAPLFQPYPTLVQIVPPFGCAGATLAVVVPGDAWVDDPARQIGQYLRDHDANDRVVVDPLLLGAPAI